MSTFFHFRAAIRPAYNRWQNVTLVSPASANRKPARERDAGGTMSGRAKMTLRGFAIAAAAAGTIGMVSPAHAVTEIQFWHAMTGGNNEVIVKLANDFNASQSDYKVVPTYKGSYPDTMNAGIAAFRAGSAPHILQVFEVGTATMMAAMGAV
jgi:ABC-type glycerol-3-phosphate transport system substrate-binding protein